MSIPGPRDYLDSVVYVNMYMVCVWGWMVCYNLVICIHSLDKCVCGGGIFI